MTAFAQHDELVSIFSSALSAPHHVVHPDIPTKNVKYILVTVDIEQGRDGFHGDQTLTEIGISAIPLSAGVSGRRRRYIASKLMNAMMNKHFRVLENGSDWYLINRYVKFAGTKSEFGQSEWVCKSDVRREVIRHLDKLRQLCKDVEARLIFFAFDERMEMSVLRQLGIDPNQHFFRCYDIQALAPYIRPQSQQPSLFIMATTLGITTSGHHNGLNDAVYEVFVLLNIIFQRALDRGIPLITGDFTADLVQALNIVRCPLQQTSKALLSMDHQRNRLCNNCGKLYHIAADCRLFCIRCADSQTHASTGPFCPLNRGHTATVVADSPSEPSPLPSPESERTNNDW